MKKAFIAGAVILAAVVLTLVTGVGPGSELAASGHYIIEAEDVAKMLKGDNVVLVDMQESGVYASGHINGAVNITRDDIVVNTPYPNLVAPKEQVAEVLGSRGIDNETVVIIYDADDSKNMDAARLWWTMLLYGHENVMVVSGGFEALKRAGLSVSSEPPAVITKVYEPGDAVYPLLATLEDVEEQVINPKDNVILLDTRTIDEFNRGTIPGAVLVDYQENIFVDGTYRPIQHILLNYKQKGITADKEIIIFCTVSVRGSQTFLALYNAGYRNIKLYDGAWAEYSDVGFMPQADDKLLETEDPAPQAPVAPGCS